MIRFFCGDDASPNALFSNWFDTLLRKEDLHSSGNFPPKYRNIVAKVMYSKNRSP
jgi:hypothetical protein